MLKYNNPVLAYILAHWTVTLLLPSLILLVAALALITRRWDQKDLQSSSAADAVVTTDAVPSSSGSDDPRAPLVAG